MFDRFDDDARALMDDARRAAHKHGHEVVAPEHVLLAMLERPRCAARRLLEDMNVSTLALRAELVEHLRPGTSQANSVPLPFSSRTKQVLEATLEEASLLGHEGIGTGELLLAIARIDGPAREALRATGIEATMLRARAVERLGGNEIAGTRGSREELDVLRAAIDTLLRHGEQDLAQALVSVLARLRTQV